MKDVAGPALLWIDDEISGESADVKLLELEGYRVYCAATGTTGLAMARAGDYDCILLDLRLPDIPGLAVLAALRAEAINAPVLVLTGFGDTESAFAARHFGADGFKCKPVIGGDLSMAVQQTLQRALTGGRREGWRGAVSPRTCPVFVDCSVAGRAARAVAEPVESLVTFEDAYYEYKGELVDYRPEVHPLNPARNGPQTWFTQRRTLVFDYSTADAANPDVLFAKLLSHYHVQYFDSSEYRLVREGQWLRILPKAGKNAKGELIDRASRLDVRVTFPDAERTAEATIKLLVDTINKTASPTTNILLGGGGENLFPETKVRTGAKNEWRDTY